MTDAPELCRSPNTDPEWWFAGDETNESRYARLLCFECPLYWACREYALDEGIPEGIWGGLSGRQREQIWKGTKDGKPTGFLESIDAQTRPLLQARRDAESEWSAAS